MTITEMDEEQQLFFNQIKTRYQTLATKDSLTRLRAKAWERLEALGLPNRKHPSFRPIKLRSLFSHQIETPNHTLVDENLVKKHLFPDMGASIVFINGCYSKELSNLEALPNSVVIETLEESMKHYSPLLNSIFGKKIAEEVNPFALINTSCQTDGLFMYVPPKVTLERPIQVLHLVTCNDQSLVLPRINLFQGALSEVKIEHHTAYISGEKSFVNGMFEVMLEEGAKLHVTETLADAPKSALHFQSFRATQKRDSSLKGIFLTNGAKIARSDFSVSLIGENAEVDLSGLWILRDLLQAHIHITIDHQAPNCRSMQLFKGVLYDQSRSSFDGEIYVRQAAQQTNAYQMNNNLIMSDKARADTKPNLQIFADDVKASHGATVGQLDDDLLFYLKTRGVPKDIAQDLLIEGFCQQVIDLVPYSSLKTLAASWE
ncbi:Fe-S cluster assembly protein SufD [Chlamydiales bacterium]|nr:Fe-S cluster assembly protein SufD [Chlamydiales bacterium]